jgi:2-oxoisovalerate dehydrogenase E1 component alpha subunit
MKQAHDRARAGEGPTLIECKTYRFQPHTSDDDDRNYRSREEVQEARDHDPLVEFGRYLSAHDILDEAEQEALRATVKTEVDGHIAAAWEAGDPDPATSLRHVFAEDA